MTTTPRPQNSSSTMDISLYFIRSALWPAIVFTILVMMVGCFGNSLIIYIYRHHFHHSVSWLFIYVLAVLDLLASLISMPSELLILVTFTNLSSEVWCKISRYLSFTFHGSSCVILMAIAFNRYEKVCRPNNQFLNLKRAKYLCGGTILFACLSYIPCLFIYGEFVFPLLKVGEDVVILPYNYNMTQVNMTSDNITMGTFCMITQESNMGVVLSFYLLQFFLYVSLVILIIFFYSRVICKMFDYSQRQQQFLFQMNCQASRADHVRDGNPIKNVKDEPTADFSKDSSQNQLTYDLCKEGKREGLDNNREICTNNGATSKDSYRQNQDVLKIQISPPIMEKQEEEKFIKQAGSENNLHLISPSRTSSDDPLRTNQLLMRRVKSSENFQVNISKLHLITPPIDPYDAMFEPLFLHAPKIQKKKEKSLSRKSEKRKIKSVSRSKSNVDISLRMARPSNRDNTRSLEGLATMHCGKHSSKNNSNNKTIQDGTLTLTRRTTPKGCKNCIIPIATGLSIKSAVSYNALNPTDNEIRNEEHVSNQSIIDDKNGATTDDKVNKNELESAPVQTDDHEQQADPRVRKETVSFKPKTVVIKDPNHTVFMRKRSGSGSNPASRSSENILTPSPKRFVEYRRRQSVRPIRTNRMSMILFWISLAFVLSFLPFWIIVIIRMLTGPNLMADVSHVELGLMSVFIRFTLISNAINPLIYSLMNSQFRNRCSNVFKRSKEAR